MKGKKQVSVLAIPVGQEAVVRLVPSELHDRLPVLQEFVGGGNVCSQAIAPHLSLYANDQGVQLRLPHNRCGFVW